MKTKKSAVALEIQSQKPREITKRTYTFNTLKKKEKKIKNGRVIFGASRTAWVSQLN